MIARIASCSCGQLTAACDGDPVRIGVCHCHACQKRTGSAFGAAAFYPEAAVALSGAASEWTRIADSGNAVTFRFCPTCGTTLYWTRPNLDGRIAIAVGAFADPAFPSPGVEVNAALRHPWVSIDCPESRA